MTSVRLKPFALLCCHREQHKWRQQAASPAAAGVRPQGQIHPGQLWRRQCPTARDPQSLADRRADPHTPPGSADSHGVHAVAEATAFIWAFVFKNQNPPGPWLDPWWRNEDQLPRRVKRKMTLDWPRLSRERSERKRLLRREHCDVLFFGISIIKK